jgi:hypothetical protein
VALIRGDAFSEKGFGDTASNPKNSHEKQTK